MQYPEDVLRRINRMGTTVTIDFQAVLVRWGANDAVNWSVATKIANALRKEGYEAELRKIQGVRDGDSTIVVGWAKDGYQRLEAVVENIGTQEVEVRTDEGLLLAIATPRQLAEMERGDTVEVTITGPVDGEMRNREVTGIYGQ